MKYTITRSYLRNLLTGREFMARKLVIEDGILWRNDNGEVCTINLVAYSGEHESNVYALTRYSDGTTLETVVGLPNRRLFEEADRSEDALTMYIFRAVMVFIPDNPRP